MFLPSLLAFPVVTLGGCITSNQQTPDGPGGWNGCFPLGAALLEPGPGALRSSAAAPGKGARGEGFAGPTRTADLESDRIKQLLKIHGCVNALSGVIKGRETQRFRINTLQEPVSLPGK